MLNPVNAQLENASSAITDTNKALRELVDGTNGLKGDLTKLEKDLKALQDGKGDTKEVLSDIGNLRGSLLRLRNALNNVKTGSISTITDPLAGMSSAEAAAALDQVNALHDVYKMATVDSTYAKDGSDGEDFETYVANYLQIGSSPLTEALAKTQAKKMVELYATYASAGEAEQAVYKSHGIAAANAGAVVKAEATAASTLWTQTNNLYKAYINYLMDEKEFMAAALIYSGKAKDKTAADETVTQLYSMLNYTEDQFVTAQETATRTAISNNLTSALSSAGVSGVSITEAHIKGLLDAATNAGGTLSADQVKALLSSSGLNLTDPTLTATANTLAAQLPTMQKAIADTDTQAKETYEQAVGMKQAFAAAKDAKTGALDFEDYLYGILLLDDSYKANAKATSQKLYEVYTLGQDLDDGVINTVLSNSDAISEEIDKINKSIKNLNQSLASLAGLTGPTSDLMQKLADLSDDIEDLTGLLDDADALIGNSADLIDKLPGILDDVDALQDVIDKYEPVAQDAIDNAQDIAATMNKTLEDTGTFADSFEDFMQTSGYELDEGTRASLSSLAATLRDVAKSVSTTNDVKDAKDIVSELIEDTWNDYTGDVNNLLLMDAAAEPVSLTDPRNPSPKSVQVLIRTQEIKVEEPEAVTVSANTSTAETGPSTFWGRVAAMFTTMWSAVVGRLHHA